MQDAKLWASENSSRGERCRLKAISKNFLIELGGFPPKDVIASYKLLKIIVQSNSKQIAIVKEDMTVEWLHDQIPTELVRVALHGVISDMG